MITLMKLFPRLVRSLLMAASVGLVVPLAAQTYGSRPGQAPQKGAEEEPAVAGVEREWNGGWLGLAIEQNAFVLRFYDAEKKPVAPAAARAAVRWDPIGRAGTDRAVMNPGMIPDALRSPSTVRLPHLFIAWVTLLDAEGTALGAVSFDLRELE